MESKKENLKGLPIDELEARMVQAGHPSFRGRQLFRWINQRKENDFKAMSELSKAFRKTLSEHFSLPSVSIVQSETSEDGTTKYLIRLIDGHTVEAVYIPAMERSTLCVSTQVGCKMRCVFCATGQMGFIRDLKSWEIVDQYLVLDPPKPISNIVLMGMGEPFDNYDEVTKALRIFQDPSGLKIGKRHITVSTVGIGSKIQSFLDANLGQLAISIHGTTDDQRRLIMPISKKYPLSQLMDICKTVRIRPRLKITFEYLLIRDFNDSDEDARRFCKLLEGIPAKINLIAYNENSFVDFKRPSEERILQFQKILSDRGLTATYRRSRGRDISAACGQLYTEDKRKKKSLH